MAISDLLNRRVRALPDEDEDVYSEESTTEERSADGRPDESGSDDLGDEALDVSDDNVRFEAPIHVAYNDLLTFAIVRWRRA
jgi:ribosomal RNA-processing protein 36